MYHAKLTVFDGQAIADFKLGQESLDLDKFAYRIGVSWDDEGIEPAAIVNAYLDMPETPETTALLFGSFANEDFEEEFFNGIMKMLLEKRDRLPRLRAIFFGDADYEESMISNFNLVDFSDFLEGFPGLQHLHIRGVFQSLSPFRHISLKKLTLESPGIEKSVVNSIVGSVIPELEHLELWFGDDNYSNPVGIEDVTPLLSSCPFPKLKYLGLKNSEVHDEIAKAIANASVLDQIETLDMAGGTLSDEGATPLLESEKIRNLKQLDLQENLLTEKVTKAFEALSPVTVDVSEQRNPAERYIAVGE